MQVPDYCADLFASKFGGIPGSTDLLAKALAGGDFDFMSALKEFAQVAAAKAPQRAQAATTSAAVMPPVCPPMNRVNVIPEDELVLSTLSPEAAQKYTELIGRLDKMCADYPGAYYRFNPAIFQKMADDPAFEEKIYKAVDEFEAANAKLARLSGDWNKACSMHVDEDGDFILLTGIWKTDDNLPDVADGEDYALLLAKYWESRENAEDALWELIFSNEAKRDLYSTEELCDMLLPSLPQEIAQLARAAIDKREEAGKTGEAEKAAETSAA